MKSLDLWQLNEYTDMKPGLERIRAFLSELGGPQKSFKAVHVAGTNGKGSTAMMVSKILEAAGYKTGLYVSPHLVRMTERVRVNSKEISARRLEMLGRRYFKMAEGHKLTFFEFITALAYIYFSEEKIDIAVLETGLGGRFDATNVIDKPLVSVITDIALDHTAVLGKTIAAIAKEKAGIIKQGAPVVSGASNPAASSVIRAAARSRGCAVAEYGRDFGYKHLRTDWKRSKQFIEFKGRGKKIELVLPLLGEYQPKNCSLAAACAQTLNREGFSMPDKAIVNGVKRAVWPGRFDVRRVRLSGKAKTVILDGAHNPQAMDSFVRSFKESIWSKRSFDVIFGMLKDKDYSAAAKAVSKIGGNIIAVAVSSKRALEPGKLLKALSARRTKGAITSARSLKEALGRTVSDTVVITGSLYLVGEALKYLDKNNFIKRTD